VAISRLAALEVTVSFEDAATLGLAGRTALRTVRLAGPLLGPVRSCSELPAEWDTWWSSSPPTPALG
jgi:hypothetical protein